MGGGGKVKDQKKLFSVSMSTTRVYEDGRRYDTLVAEALRKTSTANYTPPVTFFGISREGAFPMMNYYNFSKWYGPYSFPTCSLLDIIIPDAQLKSIIAGKENTTVDNLNDYAAVWKVVDNITWNKFRLQEVYGHRINSNYIVITGKQYRIASVDATPTLVTTNVELVEMLRTDVYKEVVKRLKYLSDTEATQVVEEYTLTNLVDIDIDATITSDRILDSITETVVLLEEGVEEVVSELISSVETPQQEGTTPVITNPPAPLNYAYLVDYQLDSVDKSWIYYPLLGTNTTIGQTNIPGLNAPVAEAGSTLEVYPLTILRHNHFSLNEWNIHSKALDAGDDTYHVNRPPSITEQTYEDTEWVLNGLNLHLEDLLEAIAENPDIDKVSDVILCMAVEATDTHPMTSKLLFESFREFDVINNPSVKAFSMSRDPFNTAVSWEGVRSELLQTTIGELGIYKHELVNIPETIYHGYVYKYRTVGWSETYEDKYEGTWYYETVTTSSGTSKKLVTSYDVLISSTKMPRNEDDWYPKPPEVIWAEYAGTAIVMQHQATDTSVEKVTVYNLKAATVIGRSVQETTQNEATSDAFILPLVTNVVDKMTPLEKVEVMERSLRFVFYAAQMHIQNIYWYQTGIFQTILQIIAIIIIVVVSYFSAGTATAPLMAFFQSLFQAVIIGVAITIAIKFLTAIIDVPYLKEILAVVATVVSMYYGYVDTSLLNIMMTAVDLVNTAIAITLGEINADTMDIQQDRMDIANQYQEQAEHFNTLYEEFNQGMSTEKIVELAAQSTVQLVPVDSYYNLVAGNNLLTNYSLLFDTPYDTVSNFYNDSFDKNKRF